jgi:phage FluMu protein Com
MPVEFHCEHCGKHVKAPSEAAGRQGKCPHCQAVCYIPSPPEEIEELPLAPLDDAEELARKRALDETAKLQHALLHDRASPADSGTSSGRAAGGPRPGARPDPNSLGMPIGEVQQLVAAFVSAMSDGQLDRAERVAGRLQNERDQVIAIVERLNSTGDPSIGLPDLPRPVLLGFLKQLRARM